MLVLIGSTLKLSALEWGYIVLLLGLMTGSIYTDEDLKLNGFPGEGVTDGSVLVVKTHEWGDKARSYYRGVVVLVREPVDSILSEFNRQNGGGHTGLARISHFHKEGGKSWKNFLMTKLMKWEKMNLDWINNFSGPQILVSYNQLVTNQRESLEQVLEVLEVTMNKENLECTLASQEGVFRRKRRNISSLLDDNLHGLVNKSRQAVIKAFNKKSHKKINIL